MQSLKNVINSTLHLFYPQLCNGCGSQSENLLCIHCIHNLPQTNYAAITNNPIEKIFWGRMPVTAAFTEFYFSKDSLIQHLIHQLKYKSNKDIGLYLGEIMGRSIVNSNRFNDIDAIIPVPLNAAKEKKRGYNQAAIIANGISSVTKVPVIADAVIRTNNTQTQTKKHRFERWENVEKSFVVINSSSLQNKNLLLVDDVLTTGATIEAFGNAILQLNNVTLNVAALAASVK